MNASDRSVVVEKSRYYGKIDLGGTVIAFTE